MAYTKIQKQGYTLYQNENGCLIGTASGKVLEEDGLIFRAALSRRCFAPWRIKSCPFRGMCGSARATRRRLRWRRSAAVILI